MQVSVCVGGGGRGGGYPVGINDLDSCWGR